MRKGAFPVTVAVVAVACSGSTELNIQNYDRACTAASDCVVVATDACCGCPASAINMSSLAQYNADLSSAKNNCGNMTCPPVHCLTVVPACVGGVCVSELPPDSGADGG